MRCSFCYQIGHNIKRCNDSRIQNFEEQCINAKFLLEIMYISNEHTNIFRRWLVDKYLQNRWIVITFAIRKCYCTLTSSVELCFNSIISYIFYTRVEENTILNPFINTNNNISTQNRNSILEAREILILAGYSNENILEMLTNTEAINWLSTYHDNIKYNIVTTFEEDCQDITSDCSICFENYGSKNFVKLNCSHSFCNDCIIKTIKTINTNNPRCALCRTEISNITTYTNKIKNKINKTLSQK